MITLYSTSTFSFSKDKIQINQDSYLTPQKFHDTYIFAIADGVGGYLGGEIASNLAISTLCETHDKIKTVFTRTLEKIKALPPELKNASTTLTFGYLSEEGLHIGHIGDCRLYIKQGNKLRQKTKDHTSHQRLLDEGIYTKKELKELKGKNIITTAISTQVEMKYDEIFIPIDEIKDENSEIFIYLMSDGAHHFWERRPRFSDNTMNSVTKFAAALQKRIEKAPIDDYSLIAAQFKIEK
ncbi:protein phosphatase [Gallibacterium anatis]|uniref:PP2C family protein-serine/threonine phosphatase n=1 Tax=Gallibacterium anatis TaxID=750 RepID=UPI00053113D4|nr:protein phosphatase 2C domain-containing protein [Gallibacterium anatis]KGQ42868.1 protein phosphatase [Gallibacterium anatis]KGQ48704.1 protein phosphatase [Gallibacterium anatis]KGQ54631.1 protein phosphatase [Gallibacterium anatis]